VPVRQSRNLDTNRRDFHAVRFPATALIRQASGSGDLQRKGGAAARSTTPRSNICCPCRPVD
jgi:hypothetical protein